MSNKFVCTVILKPSLSKVILKTILLYTGTPNSDIRILCTVHCGRNLNKPSAPTEVEGKGLQL